MRAFCLAFILATICFQAPAMAARYTCIDQKRVVWRLSINDGKLSRVSTERADMSDQQYLPIVSQVTLNDGIISAVLQYMDTAYYTFYFTIWPYDDGSARLNVRSHYEDKDYACRIW